MPALFYLRLVGFAAGALLHLFLLAVVLGYRRPRPLERLLFFLVLALFLFYAGGLLGMNAEIFYATPPLPTLRLAVLLSCLGLGLLPSLLIHVHAEYFWSLAGGSRPGWLRWLVRAEYLPLVYFGPFVLPGLMQGASLGFLWPGSRAGLIYGIWLGGAVVKAGFFQRHFAMQVPGAAEARFHRGLAWFFSLAGPLILFTYILGGRLDPVWSAGLATSVALSSLVPSSLFGYLVLRYGYLQIRVHRNLVYAVSASFLALLYLAVVRRAGTWLEPLLPPEATASILLFVLIVFFEPLQRVVGRALHQALRREVGQLQRLTTQLQQEARHGDFGAFLAFAEARLRDDLKLAHVRITLRKGPPRPAVASGRVFRLPLRCDGEEMGHLEAYAYGPTLSGETRAALEFLADQLPAAVDVCRLIEEKLKLERELAVRERMALVGQMAARISHNLKNPLSSMKTVLQLQLENPELPESVRHDCALVLVEIDRLSAKLSQLLAYAKPSLGAGMGRERVAVVGLAERALGLLGREAERRGVALELTRTADEGYVTSSEEALSDVLANLVVNAIEAIPAGGTVQVSLRTSDSDLVLDVTDDGPGISPELRNRVFEPFFTTKPSGTGLGLAIVERRVAELGGSISVESPVRDGHGTRFRVTLPRGD